MQRWSLNLNFAPRLVERKNRLRSNKIRPTCTIANVFCGHLPFGRCLCTGETRGKTTWNERSHTGSRWVFFSGREKKIHFWPPVITRSHWGTRDYHISGTRSFRLGLSWKSLNSKSDIIDYCKWRRETLANVENWKFGVGGFDWCRWWLWWCTRPDDVCLPARQLSSGPRVRCHTDTDSCNSPFIHCYTSNNKVDATLQTYVLIKRNTPAYCLIIYI